MQSQKRSPKCSVDFGVARLEATAFAAPRGLKFGLVSRLSVVSYDRQINEKIGPVRLVLTEGEGKLQAKEMTRSH